MAEPEKKVGVKREKFKVNANAKSKCACALNGNPNDDTTLFRELPCGVVLY